MTDTPLTVKVDAEVLTIQIGNSVNAFAFEHSDYNNPFDAEKNDWVRLFKVSDPVAFSRDIKHAMLKDREDGSSPLSDFLDKMAAAAVEDGSEGIEYPE